MSSQHQMNILAISSGGGHWIQLISPIRGFIQLAGA
jgi:hypothetical protein